MSTESSPKAIIAALLANLGIAVAKFIAFLITASSSMLAETIHSLADSGNQVLLLVGGKRAGAAGDARTTRSGSAASATSTRSSSRSCCSASAACSRCTRRTTSATRSTRVTRDEMLDGNNWWWVPLVVLVAAIVMESLLVPDRDRRVQQGPRQARAGASSSARSKAPELPVVLLEDFAALIGLCFALIGVGHDVITDNGYWDVAGTAVHRRAAGARRDHAGVRDQEPAARRGCGRGPPRRDPGCGARRRRRPTT